MSSLPSSEMGRNIEDKQSSLASKIASGHATIGILGLGVVGTLTMRLVVEAGLRAIGYDRDPNRITQVRKSICSSAILSDDAKILSDADVIVIAVRAKAESGEAVNMEPLRASAATLRSLPRRDRLLLLETTVPPGTTRRFAVEWLRPTGNRTVLVAYCPERLRAGDGTEDLRAVPRLVAGMTDEATEVGRTFLNRLGISTLPVGQPEVAELSKLLENVFLTTGISLMGELTRIAHLLGINATDVAQAAATKPHGYFPFYPGAGIGGHCLPNDLAILIETATELKLDSPFLNALSVAARNLTPTVLRRLETLMQQASVALEDASVWVIGVGFKPGSSDTTNSAAIDAVRQLRARHAKVVYSDSLVPQFAVDGDLVKRVTSNNLPNAVDAALIISGDMTIPLHEITARTAIVLDAGGCRKMKGSNNGVTHL